MPIAQLFRFPSLSGDGPLHPGPPNLEILLGARADGDQFGDVRCYSNSSGDPSLFYQSFDGDQAERDTDEDPRRSTKNKDVPL